MSFPMPSVHIPSLQTVPRGASKCGLQPEQNMAFYTAPGTGVKLPLTDALNLQSITVRRRFRIAIFNYTSACLAMIIINSLSLNQAMASEDRRPQCPFSQLPILTVQTALSRHAGLSSDGPIVQGYHIGHMRDLSAVLATGLSPTRGILSASVRTRDVCGRLPRFITLLGTLSACLRFPHQDTVVFGDKSSEKDSNKHWRVLVRDTGHCGDAHPRVS